MGGRHPWNRSESDYGLTKIQFCSHQNLLVQDSDHELDLYSVATPTLRTYPYSFSLHTDLLVPIVIPHTHNRTIENKERGGEKPSVWNRPHLGFKRHEHEILVISTFTKKFL